MDTGNGRPHVYRNASDDRDERISAGRLAQIFHVTTLKGHVAGGDTGRFREFLVRIGFNLVHLAQRPFINEHEQRNGVTMLQ